MIDGFVHSAGRWIVLRDTCKVSSLTGKMKQSAKKIIIINESGENEWDSTARYEATEADWKTEEYTHMESKKQEKKQDKRGMQSGITWTKGRIHASSRHLRDVRVIGFPVWYRYWGQADALVTRQSLDSSHLCAETKFKVFLNKCWHPHDWQWVDTCESLSALNAVSCSRGRILTHV